MHCLSIKKTIEGLHRLNLKIVQASDKTQVPKRCIFSLNDTACVTLYNKFRLGSVKDAATMSSPRKYASPYLTGIPGLPPAMNKTKKRSKTSISKPNELTIDGDTERSDIKHDQADTTPRQPANQKPNFDASCGDMDQKVMNNMIVEGKSVTISKNIEEEAIVFHHEGDGETTESTGDFGDDEHETGELAKTNSNESNAYEAKSLDVETEEQEQSQETVENIPTISLKSILKKPNMYRNKLKNKEVAADAAKRPSKTSKGRISKSAKESLTRLQVKPKPGTVSVAGPKPKVVKAQGNINLKSPRRKVKGAPMKPEENDDTSPWVKKSVRFSNKVDVHPVPYESRAGTRACDWQRNMLEQRVQTFRQLMKDVGGDEIDLFGTGMLFPGYPYHLPNPNFALRGSRVRNFKL